MRSYAGVLLFFVPFFSGCVAVGSAVKVSGLNDVLEDSVEVSTFDYDRPFMGVVNPSDHYFRGYVDKISGEKTYQLYAVTNSTDWMRWNEVKILIDGDVVKRKAVVVNSDARCSQYGCARYEDVVVNLRREMLNHWSASADPVVVVRYVSSVMSGGIDIKIIKAELVAFLEKIDSMDFSK